MPRFHDPAARRRSGGTMGMYGTSATVYNRRPETPYWPGIPLDTATDSTAATTMATATATNAGLVVKHDPDMKLEAPAIAPAVTQDDDDNDKKDSRGAAAAKIVLQRRKPRKKKRSSSASLVTEMNSFSFGGGRNPSKSTGTATPEATTSSPERPRGPLISPDAATGGEIQHPVRVKVEETTQQDTLTPWESPQSHAAMLREMEARHERELRALQESHRQAMEQIEQQKLSQEKEIGELKDRCDEKDKEREAKDKTIVALQEQHKQHCKVEEENRTKAIDEAVKSECKRVTGLWEEDKKAITDLWEQDKQSFQQQLGALRQELGVCQTMLAKSEREKTDVEIQHQARLLCMDKTMRELSQQHRETSEENQRMAMQLYALSGAVKKTQENGRSTMVSWSDTAERKPLGPVKPNFAISDKSFERVRPDHVPSKKATATPPVAIKQEPQENEQAAPLPSSGPPSVQTPPSNKTTTKASQPRKMSPRKRLRMFLPTFQSIADIDMSQPSKLKKQKLSSKAKL